MHRSLLLLIVACSVACVSAPPIDQADVTRVLSALSADSMMGRRAFTPDIDRAATFLTHEFAAIGLDSLQGLHGYRQPFAVYTLTAGDLHVTLNGRPVPTDRVAVSAGSSSLHWSEADSVKIVTVGPNDDWRQALTAVRRSGADALVLLSSTHQNVFDRLRTMRNRTLALDGPSAVYVLTDQRAPGTFRVEGTANVTTDTLTNIVGVIPGARPDEIVLFSAHYDHLGVRPPVNGDSIANGANDDASGSTAVVELARWFQARGRPTRTLMFALFTAEEIGGYGSRYFSQQVDPSKIVAMFNIEMIGKVSADGPNTAWITGFDRSTFGDILQQAVAGTDYRFEPDPYPAENLFYRSDNATLARLGVPAHSISTTPIDVDTDYHQVTDEIGTLDLANVTSTIRAIAAGAATIVSGAATPTRVAPETLN